MNTQWYDIAKHVAQSAYGVVPHELPMVRNRHGHVARVNTPPAGVVPRTAAVLVLMTPHASDAALVLTRRGGHLREHGGEIAFPGGRLESNETAPEGALREAREELGIDTTAVEVIGQLHPVYVPRSNHLVTPVMAWCSMLPAYTPNPSEVAEVFLAPLSLLIPTHALAYDEHEIRGEHVIVPYFMVNQHRVWGATALMICDLVARIRAWDVSTTRSSQTRITQ